MVAVMPHPICDLRESILRIESCRDWQKLTVAAMVRWHGHGSVPEDLAQVNSEQHRGWKYP